MKIRPYRQDLSSGDIKFGEICWKTVKFHFDSCVDIKCKT